MRIRHLAVRAPEGSARWTTAGGVTVTRVVTPVHGADAVRKLVRRLDSRRGLLLLSGVEQPGRYARGATGYADPPLEIVAHDRMIVLRALNTRGRVLLRAIAPAVTRLLTSCTSTVDEICGAVPDGTGVFAEEDRTRRPSVFGVLRAVVEQLSSPRDELLGLYGAFGYDLVFQLEDVTRELERDPRDRDMVLHLPDRVLTVDDRGDGLLAEYEFSFDGANTVGLSRDTPAEHYCGGRPAERDRELPAGAYAAIVERAKESFRRGDLFEVVPGQSFHRECEDRPSAVFDRLRRRNPAPYGLFANLGEQEYLVGASPEMFVRVRGEGTALRVESCPISGTARRGVDALEDAERIRDLLNSGKEESELTMCTDVDRNDKARVCEPGSVRVVGRRQLELYSTVIHTVDHVTAVLRPGLDALDAFLTHAWAVTVTGAPKRAAIEFVERHETSARRWYGGAVGRVGFDGSLETALTLRTIHVRDGVATVRAGATLLWQSDPADEEAETELKASAQLAALRPDEPVRVVAEPAVAPDARVLLVDHQDSFVHTLADYFRQTGASVTTYRSGFPVGLLEELRPSLLVLSPGPGRPADFGMDEVLSAAVSAGLPVFGVCLGLQGIVEHFGGTLGVLPQPHHGVSSTVRSAGGQLFHGVPEAFEAGRYHSLYADVVPAELEVTARSDDGVVMAVEHRSLPIGAVQFHPESIMTARVGVRIVENAVRMGMRAGASGGGLWRSA